MKLDTTAYFQYAKDDVKRVRQHTKTCILQKNICVYAGNKTGVYGL